MWVGKSQELTERGHRTVVEIRELFVRCAVGGGPREEVEDIEQRGVSSGRLRYVADVRPVQTPEQPTQTTHTNHNSAHTSPGGPQ